VKNSVTRGVPNPTNRYDALDLMLQIRVHLRLSAVRFIHTPYQSTEPFSRASNVFSSGNTNIHFSEVWRNTIDQFISVICC